MGAVSNRRRRAMRRRSRSEAPPQTPWSIRFWRAYSRHGALTGQSAQIRRATSTPTPSFGKNVDGGISRHFPCAIHTVSITPPSSYRERAVAAEGSRSLVAPKRRSWDVRSDGPPVQETSMDETTKSEQGDLSWPARSPDPAEQTVE